ncbi:unnamed protein product [Polarella glacialis]|uniref:Uncharacterized protein n=1 Tax=Polarella glacialis TaxID=89957 RepID=A0A813JIF3_POLGL|nr:unnamed protein product [Polarella glacialis]
MSRFALLRCAAGFQRSVPIPIPQFQAAGCRPTRQVTGAPAWVLQAAFGGTAVLAASVASWRAPVQKRRLSTAHCVRNEGPPQARCWLVVLDFDCTIMVEHLWARYRDAPLAKVHIQDDTFVDLAALRRFVASVRAGGHNVAVASFGRRDVIDKGLRVALGEEHKVVVTTPADFGCPEGSGLLGNKNRQLAGLCDRFQGPFGRRRRTQRRGCFEGGVFCTARASGAHRSDAGGCGDEAWARARQSRHRREWQPCI